MSLLNVNMKSMKIMIAIPCSLFGESGDSINELQLIEAISRRTKKVIVFTLTDVRKFKVKNRLLSNVILIKLPMIRYLGIFLRIFFSFIILVVGYFLEKIYKFDLIYVRDTRLAWALMLSKELRQKSIVKIPCFFEDEIIISSSITLKILKKIFSLIDFLVLSKCKKIAIPSPLWIEALAKRRKIYRSNDYLVVPAGVNLRKIRNILRYKDKDIEELKPRSFRVGFLGTLQWWQGVEILVKAVSMLKNKDIELLIVGDGALRPQIERLAKKLGVYITITGYVPHEVALRYLSTFDVLVLPRKRIGTTELNIPIKVIEAWALGIPVITTKHKVFLKYGIRNLKDIVYCEPDASCVASAISMLLSEPILRNRLKMNGFKMATLFDYDRIAENLLRG